MGRGNRESQDNSILELEMTKITEQKTLPNI